MLAKILAQYYADAGRFVTEEQSRYSLDTIRIEPHPERGVVIIATDGHTMGVFHDHGGECPAEGITILYNSLLANGCGNPRTLEINDDGSASVLNRGREEVRYSGIKSDGKFPTWQAILPKWTKELKRTDYNPEYIERCAKVTREPYPHLAIYSGTDIPTKHADEGSSVVVPYERDDCFFLVMPMQQTEPKWPALLDALRPKEHADIETPPEVAIAE